MTSEKLKDAPIVEAMLDIRFDTKELAEVAIGRLSDIRIWTPSTKTRLPTADIPVPMRAAMAQLRYVPSLEISDSSGFNKVRVGSNVVSAHFLGRYLGWEQVFPTLETVIDGLFQTLPGVVTTRLGLRYVNVFTEERHAVRSVNDLALKVTVADAALDTSLNIIFATVASPSHSVTTRISSTQFLQVAPAGATATVDVDVFTPEGFSSSSANAIKKWVDDAHTFEKAAFRKLLPDSLYEQLRETAHARTH